MKGKSGPEHTIITEEQFLGIAERRSKGASIQEIANYLEVRRETVQVWINPKSKYYRPRLSNILKRGIDTFHICVRRWMFQIAEDYFNGKRKDAFSGTILLALYNNLPKDNEEDAGDSQAAQAEPQKVVIEVVQQDKTKAKDESEDA